MKIDLRTLPGEEAQRLLKEVLDYGPETGEFRWKVSKGSCKKGNLAGYLHSSGYVYISFYNTTYRSHRLVWLFVTGDWPKNEIDHINRIKNDNRFCNLRDINSQEQSRNISTPSNNTSGFVGVFWDKRCKKWGAFISINKGERKDLGRFVNKEDAIDARKKAEIEYGFYTDYGENKEIPIPIERPKIQKGIYWNEISQKWTASIQINKKRTFLGSFTDKEDAVRIRKHAENYGIESLNLPKKEKGHEGIRIENGRWRARVKVNGIIKHVGVFDKLEDAIAARADAEINPQNIKVKIPKGYSWDKNKKKWIAYIYINKKHVHLGYFITEEEAIAARLAAEEKYKS